VPLHIPWMFLSPFGLSGNISLDAISGDGDAAIVGQSIPDQQVAFQLVDQNGAPVVGAPVTFNQDPSSVPLTLSGASSVTDNYGFAYANVTIGSQTGTYSVDATGGGQSYTFSGTVYAQPTISANSIGDAAEYQRPIAPGSYVSIFGANLSQTTDYNYSPVRLPLSIDNVTVSFDAAATGSLPAVSYPGYLVYVSPSQINIQVPWELQGYPSAQMKVTVFEFGYGNVVTVPLASAAPEIFEVGTGAAAALDLNYHVVNASNPAVRGSYISIFCNGLGPVSNTPASGNIASANPVSTTNTTATVAIGGVAANVIFSGLAPGYPGLYQVNVQVPQNLTPGAQPLVVSIGSVSSKTSGTWVQ